MRNRAELASGIGGPFLVYPEGDYFVTLYADGQVTRVRRPKYPAVDPVAIAVHRRMESFKRRRPL